MKKIKTIFTICAVMMMFLVMTIDANAYLIERKGGFDPIPTYVQCYYDFSSETKTAVSEACDAWNTACKSKTLVTRSYKTHTNTTYPNSNGINQITRGFRGTNNYIMQHKVVKGNVNYQSNEGDIDINVSKPFGTASTSYDMKSNIMHELGHLLGLGHSDSASALMYAHFEPGEVRYIGNDDKNGINEIYK